VHIQSPKRVTAGEGMVTAHHGSRLNSRLDDHSFESQLRLVFRFTHSSRRYTTRKCHTRVRLHNYIILFAANKRAARPRVNHFRFQFLFVFRVQLHAGLFPRARNISIWVLVLLIY
jgi:hypothetical protein